MGVSETLRGLSTVRWPDADFSIDVRGPTGGEAILSQRIEVGYEAAVPGYAVYLRVSGHGDMTLTRELPSNARATGSLTYSAAAPLGDEQMWVLFSSEPLRQLFSGEERARALGADRESAQKLVDEVRRLAGDKVRIATRRYHYEVAAPPGGTEYTARGLTFTVLGGDPSPDVPIESSRCPNPHRVSAGEQDVVVPAHIEFEFDSDRLTKQGERDLDVFGQALLSGLRSVKVSLQGNTDAVGSDDYNMDLSDRRAQAAKRYLQDMFAVPSARLTTVAMGKANPIMKNDNDAGRACNRRVDFVISKPQD